ncbi:hypothetical protein AB0E88_28340 [Streptomyces sp. NPDC028635]|uniref:hypothetical protein n=1 Tax=Streptomyces sp. NPDC028635 TaxID=3154800 RepID=UPI0033F2A1A7
MSRMPRALSRSRTWLRALVLLLALLVPGEAYAATAPPVTTAAASAEHDVTDTAVRLPAHRAHRTAVPSRPAPLPDVPAAGRPRALREARPGTPCTALSVLRSVVLRC